MHDRNAGSGGGMPDGLDAIARQTWDAWNAAIRQFSGMQPPPPASPWQAALDAWSSLAQGMGGLPQANDLIGRFRAQSGPWFGQMQQLAAQFAGVDATAADVAQAWRRLLETQAGGNPFAQMADAMRGQGAQGFERWMEQAKPLLDGMRGEGASWLRLPAFGVGREHQERWQRLALAQSELQRSLHDYGALMGKCNEDAIARFEGRLAARGEADQPVESARALFDLWVDAAEDAYAETALSSEFRGVYAKLVDAQMRLRAGVQREIEQVCASFGMPTRTELDGAHRKIVELERQVRRMRDGAPAASAARAGVRPPPADDAPPPRAKNTAARGRSIAKAKTKASAKATTSPARKPAPAAAASSAPRRETATKKPAARAQASRRSRRGPKPALAETAIPAAPVPLKGGR